MSAALRLTPSFCLECLPRLGLGRCAAFLLRTLGGGTLCRIVGLHPRAELSLLLHFVRRTRRCRCGRFAFVLLARLSLPHRLGFRLRALLRGTLLALLGFEPRLSRLASLCLGGCTRLRFLCGPRLHFATRFGFRGRFRFGFSALALGGCRRRIGLDSCPCFVLKRLVCRRPLVCRFQGLTFG
ncbi:MAG: hypothetical protein ACXWVP_12225, partial [Burkholderiales bacterium]